MSAGLPNYGWRLKPVSGTSALKRFTAREGSSPDQRPRLVIQYVSPGP
jgi:hypothetical protein